jgi:hypothetical protein
VLNGTIFGHVTYDGKDVHIRTTSITDYVISGPNERIIRGTGTINGVNGTFEVTVTDGPGGTPDTFRITTSTGYARGGSLTSGDIAIQPETGGCTM